MHCICQKYYSTHGKRSAAGTQSSKKYCGVCSRFFVILKIRYALGLHFQDFDLQNILKLSTIVAEITSARRAVFRYYGLNYDLTSNEAKCRPVCYYIITSPATMVTF